MAALQRSRILAADAASAATQGAGIDHVPHLLYSAGASWRASEALSLSAWASGQSSYFLERADTHGRYGQAFSLNLSAVS